MSDADDIEEIRAKKREELRNRAEETESAAAPDTPVHVESQAHFQELLSEHDLVLVDFYADWCGPCEMLEPIVESVAAETSATVAKVDIDVHQALAQQNQVRGVPTLLLFDGGDPVERMVGVQDESTIVDAITSHA